MDIIKMTRELGAAIQQDERYIKFTEARVANESDESLMDLVGKIQLVQMNFQQESGKGEAASQEKLEGYQKEFETLYEQFSTNEKVIAFEQTRGEVDAMMNYIMQILSLCVNGEDPMTCEPHNDHECGSDCSCCSGCH